MNKYIVINSEDIQKRIEDLKISQKGLNPYLDSIDYYGIESEVNVLKQILSNSKPLTPIIEDAFEAGEKRGYELPALQMRGMSIKNTENPNKQDYINNLKLDI